MQEGAWSRTCCNAHAMRLWIFIAMLALLGACDRSPAPQRGSANEGKAAQSAAGGSSSEGKALRSATGSR